MTGFWHRLATVDHAPPGPVLRRRRRAHARARDPGVRAAPHRRRQPRRAADDRVDARAARARDDARRRARSRRTRSSSTPTGRAARATRRSSPPSAASWPSCARDPEIDARRRSPRPALRAAGAGAAGEPASTPTAASCRSAPPAARTPATQPAMDLVDADPRPLRARGRASRPATEVLVSGAPAFGVDFIDKRLRRVPVARARRARDLLPDPAARVPLGRAAGEGGA